MAKTERLLIATDEGTHGHPQTFRLYRLPDGKFQLVTYHGSSVIRNETTAERPELPPTKGRVRRFRGIPA